VTPDEAALATFDALRRKAWDDVVALSAGIVAPDRPGLEARGAAYRAQALRALGRLDEAERAAAAAVQLARRAGDVAGVNELRTLHASILSSVGALRAAAQERARDATLVDTDEPTLLGTRAGPERAAILVRRANAFADAGRRDEALACAERAHTEAVATGTPRERVLALLSAARVDAPERWIHAAHVVADDSDDQNLVTAVANAARAAGVHLRPPEF
jgi:hypothetical protein